MDWQWSLSISLIKISLCPCRIKPNKILLTYVCVCISSSIVSTSLRPHGLQPPRPLCLWGSPGKNPGVGCRSLLQGIFPTQESNPGLLHCRQILYHKWSHKWSPRILECVPLPSPADLPDPGIEMGSPELQVDFFTNWAMREAPSPEYLKMNHTMCFEFPRF